MIRAENLSKYYAGRPAIENVSFSIEQGEIVGLLGLNGAGKSTILKILGCFLLPSAGRAELSGYSTAQEPDQIRKLIGYLPDSPPLYNEMTVEDYLRYVARLKDVKGQDVDSHVKSAMERTNLVDVAEVYLGSLSHGYRQRVGIAQAIVHKPKLLILDEPINGLDPIQIVEMRDLINSLKGEHTVILSSHILSEITKTCDRILIVDRGKLVAEGRESELKEAVANKSTTFCEVTSFNEETAKKIKAIANVVNLKSDNQGASVALQVEATGDIRAQLAKVLVEADAGLVELRREEGGLEQVFMRLVQGAAATQQRH